MSGPENFPSGDCIAPSRPTQVRDWIAPYVPYAIRAVYFIRDSFSHLSPTLSRFTSEMAQDRHKRGRKTGASDSVNGCSL